MNAKITKTLEYLLLAVLFAEIALLVYYNFAMMPHLIDEDYAKLLTHVREMAAHRRIFVPHWEYMSSGELDAPGLPAAFLTIFLKNAVYAFSVINLVNVALYAFVILTLFKRIGLPRIYGLLCLAAIYAAYDFGQLNYTNMLFIGGGQYAYKVLIPLLFILVLLMEEGTWKKRSNLFFLILYYLLLLITGISSWLYSFVALLLPVCVCVGMSLLRNDAGMSRKHALIHICATALVTVAGVWLNNVLDIATNGSWYRLKSLTELREGLFKTFFDILRLYRALDDTEQMQPFSAGGLSALLRFFVIGCILFGGLYHLKDVFGLRPQKEADDRQRVCTWLISVFAWNYVILFLTSSTPRYHLPGTIPLTICAVIFLSGVVAKETSAAVPIIYFAGFSVAFLGISAGSYLYARNTYVHSEDFYRNVSLDVIEYMEETDTQTAFTVDEAFLAELFRYHDPSRTYETYMTEHNCTWNRNYYLSDLDRSHYGERNLLIAQEHVFNACPWYFQTQYTLLGKVGNDAYNVYLSNHCAMDGVYGLYPEDYAIDLPTTREYSCVGVIDQEAYLLTSEAGAVLTSPEIEFDPSKRRVHDAYTVTLQYQCVEDTNAVFELYRGEELIDSVSLPPSEVSVDLTLSEAGTYRFIVRNGQEGVLRINRIVFQGL